MVIRLWAPAAGAGGAELACSAVVFAVDVVAVDGLGAEDALVTRPHLHPIVGEVVVAVAEEAAGDEGRHHPLAAEEANARGTISISTTARTVPWGDIHRSTPEVGPVLAEGRQVAPAGTMHEGQCPNNNKRKWSPLSRKIGGPILHRPQFAKLMRRRRRQTS